MFDMILTASLEAAVHSYSKIRFKFLAFSGLNFSYLY